MCHDRHDHSQFSQTIHSKQLAEYVEQTPSSRKLLRATLGSFTPFPEEVRNQNKESSLFESVQQIDSEKLANFIELARRKFAICREVGRFFKYDSPNTCFD